MKLTIQDWRHIPFGAKIICCDEIGILTGADINHIEVDGVTNNYEDCFPLLRSFDQMTEEEKKEFYKIKRKDDYINGDIRDVDIPKKVLSNPWLFSLETNTITVWDRGATITESFEVDVFSLNIHDYDYFDSIGIDIRGWIEKGLAIKEVKDEVTKI